jgi:hypothetical protein
MTTIGLENSAPLHYDGRDRFAKGPVKPKRKNGGDIALVAMPPS